jgi:hypothetical protein
VSEVLIRNRTRFISPQIRAFLILLSGLLVTFVASLFLDGGARDLWLQEGGIIEVASAVGYFVCAFSMLYWGGLTYLKNHHYFVVMVLLFGMRELDFDKRFTTMGLLKIRLYTSPEVPVSEKMIGVVLIAVLVYVALSILKKHGPGFWDAVKRGSEMHFGALVTLLLLVVAKTIDGIGRKLGDIGISLSRTASLHFNALEEILELGIPVMLIMLFYFHLQRQSEHR